MRLSTFSEGADFTHLLRMFSLNCVGMEEVNLMRRLTGTRGTRGRLRSILDYRSQENHVSNHGSVSSGIAKASVKEFFGKPRPDTGSWQPILFASVRRLFLEDCGQYCSRVHLWAKGGCSTVTELHKDFTKTKSLVGPCWTLDTHGDVSTLFTSRGARALHPLAPHCNHHRRHD